MRPPEARVAIDAASVMAAALDCIIIIDQQGRITEFNPAAEATFGFQRAQTLGRELAELIIPEQYRARHREGMRLHLLTGKETILGRRIEISALRSDGSEFPIELTISRLSTGESTHFLGFIRDITVRKEAEAALRRSEELLTDFFENAAVGLHWFDKNGIIVRANQAQIDMLGYAADEYIGRHIGEFHADSSVVDDLLGRLTTGEKLHNCEARLRCRDGSIRWALISSNVLWDNGRFIHARCFMRDITERKLAEQELAESKARYKAHYQQEALINQIGAAVRQSLDPDEVQAAGSMALGRALGADRCFYVSYQQARDRATVGADWRLNGLPSLTGTYAFSDFTTLLSGLFSDGTAAIADTEHSDLSADAAETLKSAGCRAVLAVPFYHEGQLVAALFAMNQLPRLWTQDEIALVEQVATMTRTSIEAARLMQREHDIATQLQDALQPPVTDAVPGLAIADYYKAALGEAEVGGDFYDVFADDKGSTYLVVGDLSGKGLAAARQVAVVRNMLRLALYSTASPSIAVTLLNRVIATHGLISAFATLFISRYDGGMRTLTYVNCGQEPALLRQAHSSKIEELSMSGPVLGIMADAEYDERTVSLQEGDALAIFTDGLTEVGETRSSLLGIAGVKAMFGALPANASAQELSRALVENVNAFAPSSLCDDQCLLIAIVTSGTPETEAME